MRGSAAFWVFWLFIQFVFSKFDYNKILINKTFIYNDILFINIKYDVIILKQLNFTINDSAHVKLEKIKEIKGIQNNAEAIEFLIEQVYQQLNGED